MPRKNRLAIGSFEGKAGASAVAMEGGAEAVCRVTFDGRHPCPAVVFREGEPKWDLSPYAYLAVDVTNVGAEELLVELRLNEVGAITTGGGQVVPAGQTRTIRSFIIRDEYPSYLDEKLFGMFALPGHPSVVKTWAGVHPGAINRFSLVAIRPPKGAAVRVGNLRGEGAYAFLTEEELAEGFFPFVDDLGQYRHRDWPGKTRDVEELKRFGEKELRDLAANPAPGEWNEYGGWRRGPKLQATGHFRTEKVEGKWWLVDPDGRLFWSHGMNLSATLAGQATPTTDREHYFADLPDPARFGEFYAARDGIPVGHYRGQTVRTFNQYGWNCRRKYGRDWETQCFERARARMKSWGLNTYHSWSAATVAGLRGAPYAATLSSRGSRRIEGSEGYWGQFPDPFDEGFAATVRAGVVALGSGAADPYCIGCFVDNEMDWGEPTYLARAVLGSGPRQPAKTAAMEFLKAKYGTVERLNASWRAAFGSWQEFLSSTALPDAADDDLRELSAMVAVRYFKTVKETLAARLPGKLYLGCRFHDHYYPDESDTCDWVVRICAEHCDVVSFNRYRYSAADLRPSNADKPVIIGEWHMGALDRGMLHYTLRFAESQQHRAELYRYYIRTCLENPFVVGAHWFQYLDEPVTGRFDGENFNTGFVDVCDRPYPEMVAACRSMGASLYEARARAR